MQRALVCIGFFLFAISFLHSSAWAVTVTTNNIPATIDQSQTFNVDVSLSCSGCSDSYLRGVFYPSGTSYFGYTQDNSGNWSNAPAASCTTFFKVAQSDLNSGSWSGTLKFKVDTSSTYYNGPGEYSFKIGRYTSGCSSATFSSDTTIAILGPTATPAPAPTSTPTPTPKPANTPIPTLSPTSTPTPTIGPTLTSTPSASISGVLGESVSATPTANVATPTIPVETLADTEENKPKVLIGLGLTLLIICGILIFRIYKKGQRLFL